MPRSYLQVILAITLVIAASYYLAPDWEDSPEVSAWQKALPKTYLVNTRTSTYNEEGALTDVLEAATATFYPSLRASELESPRLYSHNLHDDTWSASSDSGRYEHRQEVLILTSNVILANDSHQVELATEQMRFDLRRNVATSKVPVTITHGASSTRADGMVADLDAQTVRLQPNVRSIYVQPKAHTGVQQ